MSPYIFIRLRVKLHSAAVTLTLPDRHEQPAEDVRSLNQSWKTEPRTQQHPPRLLSLCLLFVFGAGWFGQSGVCDLLSA